MSGIIGYLSILADDIGTLASKTITTATKSTGNVSVLFDDIITYTKLAGAKSSGIIVDDLAAISSFTNETTSDILKNELKKVNNVEELKKNIENYDLKTQEEILKELEVIKQNAIKLAQKQAAKRELPIVYKIAIGSFKNKFIIIPVVLLLSFLAPWAVTPLLILGGLYLVFEGAEAILHKYFISKDEVVKDYESYNEKDTNSTDFEAEKIKGAIKTDFILSFEIIVLSLNLVQQSDFLVKVSVLVLMGILTTVGVYGLVALLIKLDDIGLYLEEKKSIVSQKIGKSLVVSMPTIIKTISIIGTVAMLAVGGQIISHGTHALSFLDGYINGNSFLTFFSEVIFGFILGVVVVLIVDLFKKLKSKKV